MSGDLWVMARNGTTLLPSEVKKLAADYDRLRERLTLREEQLRDAVEIVNRHERTIAALREPSKSVLLAAAQWDTIKGLRAAVEAAEQEAA